MNIISKNNVLVGVLSLGSASFFGLSACVTSRQLLKPIEIAADRCSISVGKVFLEIKQCLAEEGIILTEAKYPTKVETWTYRNSGLEYTPLTASVAWIRIEVSNGVITEWKIGSQVDGA